MAESISFPEVPELGQKILVEIPALFQSNDRHEPGRVKGFVSGVDEFKDYFSVSLLHQTGSGRHLTFQKGDRKWKWLPFEAHVSIIG
ncbi:MAG: hypothetical protein ABSA74_01625 [Candidatus Staskawiczbacteria bacterium]|jgi:hypothetical protein